MNPGRQLTRSQRAEIALLHTGTVCEALVTLLCARLCVQLCFRRAAPWALRQRSPDAPIPHPHLGNRIARSIARAADLLPGTTLCLPQAMAAKYMLQRRGFPSTIHLGVGREHGSRLHAHAWLEAGGEFIITGGSGVPNVTPLPR